MVPGETPGVIAKRDITWEGFHNARDLGGLPTGDGRYTRFGALIRSADLRFVTPAGWKAAHAAGVRTIIDLRNDDEIRPGTGVPSTRLAGSAQLAPAETGPAVPYGMRRAEVPLDDIEDVAFWRYLNRERLNGTPLYYRPFLERKPRRCAAVITAIARALPTGGVLFHCGAGRDRTGLIALLLLALAGVEPDAIAADYEESAEHLPGLFAALGMADQGPVIERVLAGKGTTARDALLAVLDGFDAERYLLRAGVAPGDIATIRHHLLGVDVLPGVRAGESGTGRPSAQPS